MNIEQKLLIEMIMRQTTYTFEEAKTQLENNDNNYIKVIKESFGINTKPKEKNSINQQIYKEIRGFMDVGSKNFLMNQERQKKQQEILSRIAQQKKTQELLKKQNNKLENLTEEVGVEGVSPSEEVGVEGVSPSSEEVGVIGVKSQTDCLSSTLD